MEAILEEYTPSPYIGRHASTVKTRTWDRVKKALEPLGLQDKFYLNWDGITWDAIIAGLQRPATCQCDPWNMEDCQDCKETIGQIASQVRQVLKAAFPRKKSWSWGCKCFLQNRPGITPQRFDDIRLYPLQCLHAKIREHNNNEGAEYYSLYLSSRLPEKDGELLAYLRRLTPSANSRILRESCFLCEKRQTNNGHALPYGHLEDCYMDCPVAIIWRQRIKEAWAVTETK